MKKIIIKIMFALLMFVSSITYVGCTGGDTPPKNYNADIQIVVPENITTEHFTPEENTTYYTSPGLTLCVSVNGHFMLMNYFSLDGDKRIYDNIYFYEGDYLYMNEDNASGLFASLESTADSIYATEEKEQGYDIQLNIIKTGIYKVIFDTKTLKFDLEYKADIETPKYYTMPNCDIYTVATSWIPMAVNPDNPEEFYITNFHVDTGKDINFFSHIHTSNYIPTLDNSSQKYAFCRKTNVDMLIGGNYNVYINSKTYKVRLELINPDTADYTCVYYEDGDFITLEPTDTNTPYVFNLQISVDTQYTSVPSFYSAGYGEYTLSVVNSPDVMSGTYDHYFKKIGTYRLTINLKTFELMAELLPE